ncbi:MAG: hypothetical protein ABEH77_09380 [Halobacteriaceae archaeon]
MPSVAINVGANTNEPGVRGPVYPDGSFEFVPIPETEPTAEPPPTYADLDLRIQLPDGVAETPVHLDPEFRGYPCCERYTYGDPWGVKARPLLSLSAGDYALFYATLSPRRADGSPGLADHPDWVRPEWGAYLVGEFRLARDPVPGEAYREGTLQAEVAAAFAAVLLLGDDASGLYERPLPLSGGTGADATEFSEDSGRGPWWRRPLRFDAAATRTLRERLPPYR